MTKIPCKGTVLKQTIASVLTAVTQIISLDLPDFETENTETDTLDNPSPGIPYDPTGRVEGGKMSGELYFDPGSASHSALTALIVPTPTKCVFNIVFNNTTHSTWSFTGIFGFGGGTMAPKEFLKSKFNIKLDGIPTLTS